MRLSWEALPATVRDSVQAELGQVVKAKTADEGIMPGVAARLHLEDGTSVFLKAINGDHPSARLLLRQRWVSTVLPAETPAPRMLWSSDIDGWIVIVHAYIEDARSADLTPGSPDFPMVMTAMRRLTTLLTPCPAGAPPVGDNLELLLTKADLMLGKHAIELPTADRGMYREALEEFDPATLDGDTLIHYDLHGENILITPSGPSVIDWSFATRAAAWVDAALLAPRLVESGHPPELVEKQLAELPAWSAVPRDSLHGLAVLWTLFRIYKATFGPPEVRGYRARAAGAGRAWAWHTIRT